jgi:hypothetical protein
MFFRFNVNGGKDAASSARVSVKKIREYDHTLIALVNGSNLFKFNPASFSRITVASRDDGRFHLVGTGNGAPTDIGPEAEVSLAYFPDATIARRAHRAVCAACTAVDSGRPWLKWGLIGIAGYVALSMTFGALGGHTVAVTDLSAGATAHLQPAMPTTQVPATAAQVPGFNSAEPTLEELAAGNYQFKPKIQAPDIPAPELNCAPKH